MKTRKSFMGMGACLVVLYALSGCYNAGELNAFLLKPRAPISGTEYRVYPPDSISISSLHVPEINGSHQIRPDGKINLPLLGEVYVTGMTPKEIEATLMTAAKDYYEQADATVQVGSYNSQKFYVFGQVGQEGPQQWTGRDALLDAITKAGPTEMGWHARICVLRVSQPAKGGYASENSMYYRVYGINPAPEDKPRFKMTINLKAMTRSGDMANNILLRPDDIVYVQPHPIAWLTLKIRSLLMPISPVLEAVRTPATLQESVYDVQHPTESRGGGGRRR